MPLVRLQRHATTRKLLVRVAAPRARDIAGQVQPYLQAGERLLDIGAGLCDVSQLLAEQGSRVTALDVVDYSCTEIKPAIYDGRTMPFADQSFDTALLLTMLHHTPDPEVVLREAQRVARRIIIIEDVYYNHWHKYATWAMDSLLNLEFRDHPHSNKTDAGWRTLFARLGLKVTAVHATKSFLVMRHRLYVLEAA